MTGKVAFVTGAARGQGRSHAIHLADEGADLIVTDIGRDIEADVRDRAGMKRVLDDAVAELGGLHVIVANAGVSVRWETMFR